MGFVKIPKGKYFESVFSCDHIIHYIQKCKKCGHRYTTENMTRFEKCLCGHTEFDGPVPVRCTNKERTVMSKLKPKAAGVKKRPAKIKKTDDEQMKDYYGIDPDKLAGKNWYCPKHAELHK